MLRSATVDVPTPDGPADAYLTRPDDDAAHPGVLVLMDAIGLRPRIEEMADRVAAAGYVVLAPNLVFSAPGGLRSSRTWWRACSPRPATRSWPSCAR